MFNFRLLLFFVGVFVLGGDSYTYPASPYGQESYGYGYSYPPPPLYSSYTPSYGGYGKTYGSSSYGSTCSEYTKVLQVLDQIWCQHAYKKSYSYTIYPTIETVIDQLEWALEFIYIPTVWDDVLGAIHELETLQDAVYGNYYDSSLLKPYYEYYDEGCEECTTSQTTGANTAGTTSGSAAATNGASRLQAQKANLNKLQAAATTFKQHSGVNFNKGQRQAVKSNAQKSSKSVEKTVTTVEVDVSDVSQRTKGLLSVGSTNPNAVVNVLPHQVAEKEASTQDKPAVKDKGSLLNLEVANTKSTKTDRKKRAVNKSRKVRGDDYTDYTCTYVSPGYCDSDKYDELLYNILDRIYTALDFLWDALEETYAFMEDINCGDSDEDEEAFQEAAIFYGSIATSYYTMLEVAEDVWRIYQIMELEYGDDSGSYYRAGGGDAYTAPPPVITSYTAPVSKPVTSTYNKVLPMQSYPYSGYVSQPPAALSYSPPSQYRFQRAAVTPAIPHYFLVGR